MWESTYMASAWETTSIAAAQVILGNNPQVHLANIPHDLTLLKLQLLWRRQ